MKKYNKLAITSFVLMIFSLILFVYFIFFVPSLIIENYSGIIDFSIIFYIFVSSVFLGIISLIFIIRKKQKGVVFALFPIVLGIILFAYMAWSEYDRKSYSRSHAITRIVSNAKQIHTALELYYNEEGKYPDEFKAGEPIGTEGYVYMFSTRTYPKSLKSKNCPKNYEYKYTQTENGQNFIFEFCLETPVTPFNPGIHIMTKDGIK